jgi:hypothetical protein
MEDFKFLNDQMILLRHDFDILTEKSQDIKSYEIRAYINVCETLFQGLTYGLAQYKIDEIRNLIISWSDKINLSQMEEKINLS